MAMPKLSFTQQLYFGLIESKTAKIFLNFPKSDLILFVFESEEVILDLVLSLDVVLLNDFFGHVGCDHEIADGLSSESSRCKMK